MNEEDGAYVDALLSASNDLMDAGTHPVSLGAVQTDSTGRQRLLFPYSLTCSTPPATLGRRYEPPARFNLVDQAAGECQTGRLP